MAPAANDLGVQRRPLVVHRNHCLELAQVAELLGQRLAATGANVEHGEALEAANSVPALLNVATLDTEPGDSSASEPRDVGARASLQVHAGDTSKTLGRGRKLECLLRVHQCTGSTDGLGGVQLGVGVLLLLPPVRVDALALLVFVVLVAILAALVVVELALVATEGLDGAG